VLLTAADAQFTSKLSDDSKSSCMQAALSALACLRC
jgi:hypothetical protein